MEVLEESDESSGDQPKSRPGEALINEARIDSKMIAIRAKAIGVISNVLHEAQLANKVSKEQVVVKWAIDKGEVRYSVSVRCALCGIAIGLPLLRDVICAGNFKRHLQRKHAQCKDSKKQDQVQVKMDAFFQPVAREEASSTVVTESEEMHGTF